MPFAAIQMLDGESPHNAVHAFMLVSDHLGKTFKRLKVLGPFGVGSATFLRFQTSCPYGRLKLIGLAVSGAAEPPRMMILPNDEGSYLVFEQGRRKGKVSTTSMQAIALPGMSRVYRGPGERYWERQFGGP